MGSKSDGFRCDHLKSSCCKEPIRFETKNGHSIQAWCSKCGNYIFTGRIEALISFWLGDLKAVKENKGYLPNWYVVKTEAFSDLNELLTMKLESIGIIKK